MRGFSRASITFCGEQFRCSAFSKGELLIGQLQARGESRARGLDLEHNFRCNGFFDGAIDMTKISLTTQTSYMLYKTLMMASLC